MLAGSVLVELAIEEVLALALGAAALALGLEQLVVGPRLVSGERQELAFSTE